MFKSSFYLQRLCDRVYVHNSFFFFLGMDIHVGNWPVLFNLYGPRAECDDAQRIQFKLTFYKILQVTNLC